VAKVNYAEGDWFAVPLRAGGFGVGVVARANPNGVLFGYFYGPRTADVPTLDALSDLTPGAAVLVGKFGHLGLTQGRWPIIGRLTGWDRAQWPMPTLIRFEELTGRTFRVHYDENDPNKVLREEQLAPHQSADGPEDGLMGPGFAELRLTTLLISGKPIRDTR